MNPRTLSVREVLALIGVLTLALAPHMLRFPPLLNVGFAAAALWRVLGAHGRAALPDREHRVLWVAKHIVAIGAFLAISIAYRGNLGREAGVELLATLLGLKLLEMLNERDYFVVAILCYFLVVTNFFYSQTVPTALYMFGIVILVTAVLVQFHTPPAYRRAPALLRQASLLTLQAVPLMAIAFVLFPRLPGPLWGLPQDAFDAASGLSETMTIGDITRLGLSNEIAFRVEFDGAEPRARDLYWRGPVLWVTDGRTWRGSPFSDTTPGAIETHGPLYHYTVTIEPQRNRWLMGLDVVTRAPAYIQRTADYALLADQPVRRRLRYSLTSAVDYRIANASDAERAAALALPAGRHPRARKQAEAWRQQAHGDDQVIAAALAFFHEQRFYYSLTPPGLRGDAVDQFLFDTREGFCEHFASSFVVLMRAAGIPARIVTGYQGGELNALGQYLVVRQRDAHAWAEVYLGERGWVRVDPTAAVAPERVSLGYEQGQPRGAATLTFNRDGLGGELLSRLRDSFDALTHGWNQWVLGYSQFQQQRLLEGLGAIDWDAGELVLALTAVLALATAALAAMLLYTQRRRQDEITAAYARFCARLARLGFLRGASEPPLAFARRVTAARADLAADVQCITRLYTQLRYGQVPRETRALRAAVGRFRPRRR